MTSLPKLMRWWLTPPQVPITPFRVMRWWEARRSVFNVAVGLAAAAGFFAYNQLLQIYPPLTGPDDGIAVGETTLSIIIAANLAYCLAWMVEGVFRLWAWDRWTFVGPKLFCGLVLLIWVMLPALCWWDYHETVLIASAQ